MKRTALVLTLLAIAFAAVTLIALEGNEVVVLHTRGTDGATRATRAWIAAADGSLWIEAANPERPFYRDIQADRRVALERGGTTRPYTATPHPGRAGHERIRALLRERYGWADWWIGLLTDTSDSILVELQPAD
jgi:hypothetical protein